MNNFQKDIDDRTDLTLSNRLELLLSHLGKSAEEQKSRLLDINIFRLHEIVPMPTFTRPASMKASLLGMVNIRDQVIPVIDLPAVAGCKSETGFNILLITEYARSAQAFAVELVENIMRLDWQQVHTTEKAINGRYITSIVCLDDNKETNNLALVPDVEQALYGTVPANHDPCAADLKTNRFNVMPGAAATVADDPKVARAMLEKGLNTMEISHLMHVTGQDAREKIQQPSAEAQAEGKSASGKIALVLTNLETSEIDGFTPTCKIKTDEHLKKIPVVVHSSLSGSANEDHACRVKADGYVAKLEVNEFSSVIQEVMDCAVKDIGGPLASRQLLN